jgi:PilZ domain
MGSIAGRRGALVIKRIKLWLLGSNGDRLPEDAERLLAAYYWDGAVPVPHKVRNVSAHGAYILTSQKWYPGTVVDLSLEYNTQPAGTNPVSKLSIAVRSRIISHGPDGMGVEFVCVNRQEREKLVEFLDDIRSRGGQ